MSQQKKKTRKNITVNLDLMKRAKKILGASNDSQAIEMLLKSVADRKTNEEVWKATEEFIKSMQGKKFKPLFS